MALGFGKELFSNMSIKGMVPEILKDNIAANKIGSINTGMKHGSAIDQTLTSFNKAKDLGTADEVLSYLGEQSEKIGTKATKAKGIKENILAEQNMALSDLQAAIGNNKAGYKDEIDNAIAALTTQRKQHAQNVRSGVKGLPGVAKDYFVGGTFGESAARIGAAGAVYAGAAVGSRYVTGGGATYNNRGERDIAGIPFL